MPNKYQLAKPKDANSKKYIAKYGNKVWELDALDPKELQQIVKDVLESYRPTTDINDLIADDKDEVKNIRDKIGYSIPR